MKINNRLMLGMTAAAITVIGLTGCSNSGDSTDTGTDASVGTDTSAAAEDSASDDTSDSTLSTADTDLGTIIVDGNGMTVYRFDNDTEGGSSSSCEGMCADNWPAVHGDHATLDGVDGDVGTIAGVDGEPQLTLDGWPLYYFKGDEAAGDVAGEGLMDTWWVLSPQGEPITN